MEIRALDKTSIDTLYEAFCNAFSEYNAPTMTKKELGKMLERRGFSPKHSFGAFDADRLVSFTFWGIGEYAGKQTAYDAGTGTIKEYRGRRLPGRVFEASVPTLKERGVKQCLLEVQQQNTTAFNIYKKQGFEISREFNYSIIPTKDFVPIEKKISSEFSVERMDMLELEVISSFWDFQPSWQNSLDSINRSSENFDAIGVFRKRNLVAYGIIEPNSGDITQLAVDYRYRRQGLATILLNQLVRLNKSEIIKIVNSERGHVPMEKFLDSFNLPETGTQYEMIKPL